MQPNERHMPKSLFQALAPIVILIFLASSVLYVVHLFEGIN